MDRSVYEKNVFTLCTLIDNLMDKQNTPIIKKEKICQIWDIMSSNRPDVPGYWLTDAMEKWGKCNGYEFMFNTNKHGKRKNVMLVKA